MKNLPLNPAVLLQLFVALNLSACAVMDKNTPGWSQYRIPDQANELRLASNSIGRGDPVLLIHGFGASSYSWRHIIAPLSQKYRVITIYQKGFGESPKPRDDATPFMSKRIRRTSFENNLKDLHIVGHSYGGGGGTCHIDISSALIASDKKAWS